MPAGTACKRSGMASRFETSWSRSPGAARRSSTSASSRLPRLLGQCQPAPATKGAASGQAPDRRQTTLPNDIRKQGDLSNQQFHMENYYARFIPDVFQGGMPQPPPSRQAHPERVRAMVWSLAFSPDGRSLAIGQQAIDRPPSIFRIWDLAQHRDIAWFQHPVGYRSVAFSSDGRSLAAGNFDGTLSTFDLTANGSSIIAKTRVRRSIPWRSSPVARHSPPATGTAGSGSMVRIPWPTAVHSSIRAGSGPSPSARMDRRWRSGAMRTQSRFTTWRHGNTRGL